jgi:hypothetical protein
MLRCNIIMMRLVINEAGTMVQETEDFRVDPVTGTQENYSTYQYSWNNPFLRSDPNGDGPICPKNGMSFVENVYYDTRRTCSGVSYRQK